MITLSVQITLTSCAFRYYCLVVCLDLIEKPLLIYLWRIGCSDVIDLIYRKEFIEIYCCSEIFEYLGRSDISDGDCTIKQKIYQTKFYFMHIFDY
jgi:hypothetical protein